MFAARGAGLAAGPFVAACALLVIAGARKIARPQPARAAVTAAAFPLPAVAVALFGAIELATGVAGAILGGRAALAVAAVYLALAAFAWRLLRRAPATPCACLGSSAPVSRTHVLVDVGAAVVAFTAAFGGAPLARIDGRPLEGIVFAVLAACCLKLVAITLDSLPSLDRLAREGTS